MIDQFDVYLAALAIDAYNRGYNEGVPDLETDTGTSVGAATIYATSEIPSASFYAIAYELDGKVVISYRGTDTFGAEGFPDDLDAWRIALSNPRMQ